jgi:hypothetical protein
MKSVCNRALTALVLVAVLALSGCGGNGKKAEQLATLLTNSSGQSYVVVKATTKKQGWSVFQNTVTGEYVAYNISKFDPETMPSLDAYLATLNQGDSAVHDLAAVYHEDWVEGYLEVTYVTHADGSETRNETWHPGYWDRYYTYERGGISFELKRVALKDLETLAAAASEMDAGAVRGALVAQYGFSQERAAKVATLTRQMGQIAGSRELTDADKTLFTEQALGVEYKELKDAVRKAGEGQGASFDQLLQRAADANGTSPELTRQLILDMSGEAQ